MFGRKNKAVEIKTTEMRKPRGFAAMDPEKQRKLASMGGKASHGGGRRPKAL